MIAQTITCQKLLKLVDPWWS